MNNNQKDINNPNYKHGGKGTKLYMVWVGMKQRILNPNKDNFYNYGGRGITICPEWIESFIVFKNWALNNGYTEGLQINRIENDGNYEPNNCNFITSAKNCQNRRNNKLSLEKANEIRELYKTGNYTYKELSIKYNIHYMMIFKTLHNKIWRNI